MIGAAPELGRPRRDLARRLAEREVLLPRHVGASHVEGVVHVVDVARVLVGVAVVRSHEEVPLGDLHELHVSRLAREAVEVDVTLAAREEGTLSQAGSRRGVLPRERRR
jgi:hypothetical protein